VRVEVRVTPEAERQILDASAWWRANRRFASDLFDDEFARALALLSRVPDIGRRYRRTRIPGLRRILLAGSRYHVYYVHDAKQQTLIVLAVWSALRGRRPSLLRA
jgi:plasmid stabilization system protein ParE